jgi:hypothetical protein
VVAEVADVATVFCSVDRVARKAFAALTTAAVFAPAASTLTVSVAAELVTTPAVFCALTV